MVYVESSENKPAATVTCWSQAQHWLSIHQSQALQSAEFRWSRSLFYEDALPAAVTTSTAEMVAPECGRRREVYGGVS